MELSMVGRGSLCSLCRRMVVGMQSAHSSADEGCGDGGGWMVTWRLFVGELNPGGRGRVYW